MPTTNRSRKLLGLLSLLALSGVACERELPLKPGTAEVEFDSTDGFVLKATLYPVKTEKPAGLILVHMLGSSGSAWEAFAARAQSRGYLCIAPDLAGHGGSEIRNGVRRRYSSFTRDEWLARTGDIASAKARLIQEGADPDRIGIVGASIGANLALLESVRGGGIHSLVLLSPGLDYKGVQTRDVIMGADDTPVLLISSEGDSYSASSCRTLKNAATGFCELRVYPGSAHGTDILDSSESAVAQIFQWFETTL